MEKNIIIFFCVIVSLLGVSGVPITTQGTPLTPQEETLDVIVDTLGARVDLMEKTLKHLEAMVFEHGDAIEAQDLQIQEMLSVTSKTPVDSTTVVAPTDKLSRNNDTENKLDLNETITGLINKNDINPDKKVDNNKEPVKPGKETLNQEVTSDTKKVLGLDGEPETGEKEETKTELENEQEFVTENETGKVTGSEGQESGTEQEQELIPEEPEVGTENEQELNPEEIEEGSENEQELNPEEKQKLGSDGEEDFASESEQDAAKEVEGEMSMENEEEIGNDSSQESEQTSESEATQEASSTDFDESTEYPPFEPAEFIDDPYEEHSQDTLDNIFGMPFHTVLEPATFDDEQEMEPFETFPSWKLRKQWRKRGRKNRRKL